MAVAWPRFNRTSRRFVWQWVSRLQSVCLSVTTDIRFWVLTCRRTQLPCPFYPDRVLGDATFGAGSVALMLETFIAGTAEREMPHLPRWHRLTVHRSCEYGGIIQC